MEKKEKRKQQSQKEVKPELVSPVSQEVPFNKLCSKNMKGMKRSLNKKRTGTPGIKRKRTRLSSCSSEPLSPDEHGSTASTPTTPKVSSVASLPEVPESFCTYGTPSTSPNGSFRFPKDEKQVKSSSGWVHSWVTFVLVIWSFDQHPFRKVPPGSGAYRFSCWTTNF